MLSVTMFWIGTIWQRVLHRGARRAATLLLWELDRMARLILPAYYIAFQNLLWYFYYIFRAGIPVPLLWISWASDEDVLAEKMPAWLKSIFALNSLILANDIYQQMFTIQWNEVMRECPKKLAWSSYAYWTLCAEVLVALLEVARRAHRQCAFTLSMLLP